jgi:hypothetical protein
LIINIINIVSHRKGSNSLLKGLLLKFKVGRGRGACRQHSGAALSEGEREGRKMRWEEPDLKYSFQQGAIGWWGILQSGMVLCKNMALDWMWRWTQRDSG